MICPPFSVAIPDDGAKIQLSVAHVHFILIVIGTTLPSDSVHVYYDIETIVN